MAEPLIIDNPNGLTDFRWGPMMTLSVILHLAVFIGVLVIPESMPRWRTTDIVYEVNLVEMPSLGSPQKKTVSKASKNTSGKSISKKNIQAKRIGDVQNTKKPLVISKRTTKKRTSDIKKTEVSSSKLIDQAISKIEKSVESDEKVDEIGDAISKLEEELRVEDDESSSSIGSPKGSPMGGQGGVSITLYQVEVESKIKSNWAYPMALRNQRNMEAIVELRVKRNGTVINYKFLKPSSDSLFDNSIVKAIEKSKPLPPFPEIKRENYDDIEIRFRTEELQS